MTRYQNPIRFLFCGLIIVIGFGEHCFATPSSQHLSCQFALSFNRVVDEIVQLVKHSSPNSEWKPSIVASLLSEKRIELEQKYGKAITDNIFSSVHQQVRRLKEQELAKDQGDSKQTNPKPTNSTRVLFPFEILTIPAHDAWVNTAVFSHNNKLIASSSNDHLAKIWDATNGKEIFVLEGHSDIVQIAEFSHDDKLLLTGSQDGSIIVWDVASGAMKFKYQDPAPGLLSSIQAAIFSSDDTKILFSSHNRLIKVLDLIEQKLVFQSPSPFISALAYSHDFNSFISGGNGVQLWDTHSATIRLSISEVEVHNVSSVAFSPDDRNFVISTTSEIMVFDSTQGKLLFKLEGHKELITSATYSPDGRFIVTTSYDQMAKIWDAKTGQFLFDLKNPASQTSHQQTVKSAQFSNDNQKIVTAGRDNTIRVWALYPDLLTGDTQ